MPYTINGQSQSVGEEPHTQNGVVYVPLRDVVSALGGSVNWDNENKQASATIGQWTANFTLSGETADVNGTTVQFQAPSYVKDGTLYVPADFFRAAYGYKVSASGDDVSISL